MERREVDMEDVEKRHSTSSFLMETKSKKVGVGWRSGVRLKGLSVCVHTLVPEDKWGSVLNFYHMGSRDKIQSQA